tara:strand:+ start:329 stop:544 length:216 start_codon:yes stop_codon:yes gene_type:complete
MASDPKTGEEPVRCEDAEFQIIDGGERLLIQKYDPNDYKVEELTLTPKQFEFLKGWISLINKPPEDEPTSD